MSIYLPLDGRRNVGFDAWSFRKRFESAFRAYGGSGGRRRAARRSAAERSATTRRTATARWVRHRFGGMSFEELGLPGGDIVDAGLEDLASGRTTPEALAVSLAAPRLRREGVPVGGVEDDPERRLFEHLAGGKETSPTAGTTRTSDGWYPSRTRAVSRASIASLPVRRELTRALRALMEELARTAPSGESFRVYLVGGRRRVSPAGAPRPSMPTSNDPT